MVITFLAVVGSGLLGWVMAAGFLAIFDAFGAKGILMLVASIATVCVYLIERTL
jgi:hypothetical protein